ncbi:hypothetical protein BGZ83_009379 [Gryganskiella cystojenkinii]|nr:hypothetical protein BGZ83_009379 [Gryganskiella cystojenkinii]
MVVLLQEALDYTPIAAPEATLCHHDIVNNSIAAKIEHETTGSGAGSPSSSSSSSEPLDTDIIIDSGSCTDAALASSIAPGSINLFPQAHVTAHIEHQQQGNNVNNGNVNALNHAHTSSYSSAVSSSGSSVNASRGSSSATTATMATTFSFASLSTASSPSSCYPTSSSAGNRLYDQEPFGSTHQKSTRITRPFHSQRTHEEMDSDMDIISALGIADQPYERIMMQQNDYFSFSNSTSSHGNYTPSTPTSASRMPSAASSASLPPVASPYPHSTQPHHHHHNYNHHTHLYQPSPHYTSLKPDAVSSRLVVQQEDSETRQGSSTAASVAALAPKRALPYGMGSNNRTGGETRLEHDYSLDEGEEDDEEEEEEEDQPGTLTPRRKKPSPPSILDEEMEMLSPFPFSDLPSLTNIGLCSRGIVKLSSNIRLLTSATCVQICCNHLTQIPIEIGFLRNLTLLDLSKNNLQSLPESIMHLTKLVDLKLSSNQLVSLPEGIGGLTKLAVLALDSNKLESIPSQIGNLKGLVHLDLSHNPLTVLPAEVGKLQYLRRLFLERCPLVEEFVHSPLHSPPTLLELAARVLVRHDIPVPEIVPPHLKSYIKSARRCTFCDGPYFDSWVKRGKMIEKNDIFIPLEYTLCQPHWNTELERVKLLFCKRPITSPSPWIPRSQQQQQRDSGVSGSSSGGSGVSGGNNSKTLIKGSYQSGTSASSSPSNNSNSSNPQQDGYPSAIPRTRRGRKNTLEGGERERPLSVIGTRLSMLLRPKSERRERPQSILVSTTATPAPPGVDSSGANDGSRASTAAATSMSTSLRPKGSIRNATSVLLERTGLRTRSSNRPLSLGSAMMESSPAIMTTSAYRPPPSSSASSLPRAGATDASASNPSSAI